MADFYQNGLVPTLHQLRRDSSMQFETDLRRFSRERSVGVVLPALYSEFENDAVYGILDELRRVNWMHRVVLVLSNATAQQYAQVRDLFVGCQSEATVLWRESPAVQEYLAAVNGAGLAAAMPGKGRACWLGVGYLLAKGDVDVIAFQDCDIKTYRTRMLSRLVYPLLDASLGFEFSKAYYPRFTGQLNGRVTRLYLTPLVRALQDAGVNSRFLRFLDSFRYGLSGEIAMTSSFAKQLRIAPDWGLEISTLSEVYQRVPLNRVCQVDIAECYDHKHQALSPDDASKGLHKMCVDIAKALFQGVCADGAILPADLLRMTLPLSYERAGRDMIDRYGADSSINSFEYDRNAEEFAVETFAGALAQAGEEFAANPRGVPALPSWKRLESALPNAAELLAGAVQPQEEWQEAVSA